MCYIGDELLPFCPLYNTLSFILNKFGNLKYKTYICIQ